MKILLILAIIIMSYFVIKHMLNDPNGKPRYPKTNTFIIKSIGWEEYVGAYKINESWVINFTKKPNIIYRVFTRILLGWKWEDIKK